MKPNAIVYTSNTGYTQQYARLLGEKTGLPVYALSEMKARLAPGTPVLYLGWIMAGKLQGYSKAAGYCRVLAACGVGMGATGSQIPDVRKANRLPETLPVFTLQGGFDITRLRCVYKLMMTVMAKTLGKRMAAKQDRTPEEDDMLDMLLHGGNRVSPENLTAVLEWLA